MAEIVQQVIETSIQDLSILEKYNLFDSSEIKDILKKRREYEYRLRKVRKTKDDFLRYISYEENLLKLVRARREKSGLEIDRNEIEKSIVDHIKNLFEFTINKFKADIPLWLSYINFCKHQNQLDHVSIIYFRLLQIHNKDWIWLQFAKFEFEDKASSETARKVFLKAINFHRDSKQIWLEYFKFELLYCTKIKKRFTILTKNVEPSEMEELRNRANDAIWNGELALIVYRHAIDTFTDFDFSASFIDICNIFDYANVKEVKNTILEDIKSRFNHCEQYWNLLATEKLQEYKQKVSSLPEMSEEQQLQLKQDAYRDVISTFETACLTFNNTAIWSFYITFRLDDLKETTDQDVVASKIAEICFTLDKIWKEEKVSFNIFQKWIKLMYKYGKKDSTVQQKLHKLFSEASERWPDNLEAHLFMVGIMTEMPDKNIQTSVIEKFFSDSLTRKFTKVDQVNMEMIMKFWELYLTWSIQCKVPYHKLLKVINQLTKICNYAPRKMSEHFKSKVLSIFYESFGIEKTRNYYDKNKNVPPISKSFGFQMIEIEKLQAKKEANSSTKRITSIYEDLIHHFGNEDTEIWLAYLKHAMISEPTLVGVLYERALKVLQSSRCNQFIQQFTLFKSSDQIVECKSTLEQVN